jgi:predicted deacetylase
MPSSQNLHKLVAGWSQERAVGRPMSSVREMQDLELNGTPPAQERQRTIAVALHGIEPATFERCAVIRDWLGDHGIDRVTLLVIPARDLHPVGERSPEMIGWLSECRAAGDSIAQHGFQHAVCRHGRSHRREFAGLDGPDTRRAVDAGWRVLKLAGIEPDGFVAPAYAYTAALRASLTQRFSWWADLLRIHRVVPTRRAHDAATLAPAWALAGSGRFARVLSPAVVRAGAMLPTSTLRIDLHPADLRHPRHMLALEWVLARNGSSRRAATYGELADRCT